MSDYKSYLWRGYELHIGNDHSGSIGFQSSLNFLRLDLMNAGYQNIFNWMDDCHIPDVQQERWCRTCCSRSWAVEQWWSKDRWQQLSSLWKSNLSTANKCKFYTRRKEKRGHQHGQGLPIASWQGSQQVVPGFAICHSTDQVDLFKKKFTLEVSPFHMKNNLEITEIRGESRMMHPEPFISAKHSFSLPIHH